MECALTAPQILCPNSTNSPLFPRLVQEAVRKALIRSCLPESLLEDLEFLPKALLPEALQAGKQLWLPLSCPVRESDQLWQPLGVWSVIPYQTRAITPHLFTETLGLASSYPRHGSDA